MQWQRQTAAERDTGMCRTARLAKAAGWTCGLGPRKPRLGARVQSEGVARMPIGTRYVAPSPCRVPPQRSLRGAAVAEASCDGADRIEPVLEVGRPAHVEIAPVGCDVEGRPDLFGGPACCGEPSPCIARIVAPRSAQGPAHASRAGPARGRGARPVLLVNDLETTAFANHHAV